MSSISARLHRRDQRRDRLCAAGGIKIGSAPAIRSCSGSNRERHAARRVRNDRPGEPAARHTSAGRPEQAARSRGRAGRAPSAHFANLHVVNHGTATSGVAISGASSSARLASNYGEARRRYRVTKLGCMTGTSRILFCSLKACVGTLDQAIQFARTQPAAARPFRRRPQAAGGTRRGPLRLRLPRRRTEDQDRASSAMSCCANTCPPASPRAVRTATRSGVAGVGQARFRLGPRAVPPGKRGADRARSSKPRARAGPDRGERHRLSRRGVCRGPEPRHHPRAARASCPKPRSATCSRRCSTGSSRCTASGSCMAASSRAISCSAPTAFRCWWASARRARRLLRAAPGPIRKPPGAPMRPTSSTTAAPRSDPGPISTASAPCSIAPCTGVAPPPGPTRVAALERGSRDPFHPAEGLAGYGAGLLAAIDRASSWPSASGPNRCPRSVRC